MASSILFEWDHEAALRVRRGEGREAGLEEDMKRVASDMLKDSEPLAKIMKYSRLPEKAIIDMAESMGLTGYAGGSKDS